MGKKKTIENCVGTVTVSTRIQNGAITTTYQFKAGFAAHGWTDKRAKDVVQQMKSGVKNMIFADKEHFGITDTSKVTFYGGVKVLECDYILENNILSTIKI